MDDGSVERGGVLVDMALDIKDAKSMTAEYETAEDRGSGNGGTESREREFEGANRCLSEIESNRALRSVLFHVIRHSGPEQAS